MTEKATCATCYGCGYVEDLTACGDPDHCSPWATCPECGGIEVGAN